MRGRVRGAVAVVVAGLVPVLVGGPVFAAAVVLIGLACWREYLRIARNLTPAPGVSRLGAATIVAFGAAGLWSWPAAVVAAIAFAGVAAPLVRQFPRAGEPDVLTYWGLGGSGSVYIGVPVLAAAALRQSTGPAAPWIEALAGRLAFGWPPAGHGLGWVLAVVLLTWANDTAAYLVGRAAGGRRLSPRISPNKTVAGAIGGLAGAAAVGAGCWAAFGLLGGWPAGLLVGLLLGAVGQIGDLAQSFIKRQAGVKDSGDFIPGHGGVFDRVDALWAAFPVAWVLSWALGVAAATPR